MLNGLGGERVCLDCFGEIESVVRSVLLIIVYRGRRCIEAAMYGDALRLRGCCVVLEVALLIRCNKMGVMLDWQARQAGS